MAGFTIQQTGSSKSKVYQVSDYLLLDNSFSKESLSLRSCSVAGRIAGPEAGWRMEKGTSGKLERGFYKYRQLRIPIKNSQSE